MTTFFTGMPTKKLFHKRPLGGFANWFGSIFEMSMSRFRPWSAACAKNNPPQVQGQWSLATNYIWHKRRSIWRARYGALDMAGTSTRMFPKQTWFAKPLCCSLFISVVVVFVGGGDGVCVCVHAYHMHEHSISTISEKTNNFPYQIGNHGNCFKTILSVLWCTKSQVFQGINCHAIKIEKKKKSTLK